MKLSVLTILLCVCALFAQTGDDGSQSQGTGSVQSDSVDAETAAAAGILLQRAQDEMADLEAQIAREEERLERIMAELVQLRRQHAMLANAESAFLLGEELYTSGSIVWARDAFESVVENFPESVYFTDALFRLELISFELQDYQAAIDYFEELRRTSPGFENIDLAYVAAGLSTYNQGQFPQARQLYAELPPSSEYFVLAEYLTTVTYVEEGDIESAISALRTIINDNTASSEHADLADRSRIALAQILVDDREDFEAALDLYTKVSPFSSYYDIAMLGKVWTLMRLEDYQEAYNLAERVMEEVPNSDLISEFELAQANCALGAEDLDIAIRMYEDLLRQYGSSQEYYDLFLTGSSLTQEEYELERERLDRIRLGLAELKEEAYTQGDMELVELIEEEEAALRQLFTEIGYLESVLSLPVEMDTETMEQQLIGLIQRSRNETEVLDLAAGELQSLVESNGTEQDRQDLAQVEQEIDRIKLSLQDLASKFEGGMTAQHDWVQETNYGIAVATFMERELKRDSIDYLGAYYRNRIEEAYADGDTAEAVALDSMRSREIRSLNRRIDESAIECAGYFEDYLASYPDSRFIADVLVRLAQLYYDIDNLQHSERQAAAGIDEYIPEDYTRSIELYEQVLNEHSGSEVEDVALYSLGYCLESMMDFEGAVDNYRTLLEEYPESQLAAECNIRVGNYYFDILAYDSALVYFSNVLDYPGSSPNLFQHGVYKLGWTLYLTKDFKRSIATFAYLLKDNQTIDSLGIRRRGDIRILNEAREYMAYNFLEMHDMGSTAVPTSVAFLNDFGDSLTTIRVLEKMADISSEMTNWETSIEAYTALLEEDPYNPAAPTYQLKIAQAYEELGDFALAADARDRLVEEYGESSEWYANIGDEAAIAMADSLRSSSFEESIQYYLEQTVTSQDDPVAYQRANESLISRIEDYLGQYPESEKSYEYRFYLGDAYYHTENYVQAGDVYYDVAMDSSSFQRQEDALNNAFSSYLVAYEEVPGVDSLGLRQKLRETAISYSSLYPDGENVAFFLWASAPKFYNAGDYETARELFRMIYENHRGSGYEGRAARFIADSYQQEELYAEAEEWYGLAAQAAAVSGEDLGADMELLAASSAYNDAASLAESENTDDLLAAAQRWEETAYEHAGSEVAPVAMYDAAETYGKAGSIDNAVRLFQELATTYPSYENAPSGLLRAAYLLREDEQYIRAAQLYLEAYNSYPEAPDMNAALASAAKSYEEGDREDLAINVYQQIATEGAGTASAVTEAYAKIGEYNYDMGNYTIALNNFQNCLAVYDQYQDGRVRYPAMSAYHTGEISAMDYYALTPVNTENVQYKTELFNGAVANYNRTFSYLDDDYVFRAVLKIGEMQEDFANAVGFMDPPEDLSAEGEEAFYNTLMEAYDTYIQRAMETYQNGLQLAVTNGVVTDFTDSIAANYDLLLPGASAELGYTSHLSASTADTTMTTDSTAVQDSSGTDVQDGFQTQGEETTETGTEGQDEGTYQDTETETPAVLEEEEEDDEGGGCFLWPF
ncbi:MAG: tetratricopeptide repeat protein [Candidatus Aegiribacteria sp.]|nr:tetratricopeptide repeat protein [Candidatus Aegiribacteria sp.]MBD3294408.1 tetratricopeptide repeat protein [Candidatus Fermentibacteria bacterium]